MTNCLLTLAVAAWAFTALAAPVPSSEVNLAVVATPSSSYVSGDTSLNALNNGANPRNSRDTRAGGSYGNWPRTGTQWVQYEWSQPISTRKADVYWWADGQGVHLPSAARLLYWDGQKFTPVPNASGPGVEGNQYNTATFDEVTTSKLRLEIDSDGSFSTGILEWKVYDSGKSPEFPPRVVAGVDRVVVMGGKTYLNGSFKTLGTEASAPKAIWSKASGPGKVTFADDSIPVTTATFSKPGDYALKLSVGQGRLTTSSTLQVRVEPTPPASHLAQVQTRPYKVNSPLWSPRLKAQIVNWIPHCIERISDPNLREGGINNFLEAAKKLKGEPAVAHRGYVFANAWVHNTVEAICLALMIDPQGDAEIIQAQTAMKATLEDWIPKILAAQEPDGYMQTAFTLSGREHWVHRGDHEGYVAGYFLESAIAHMMLTEQKDKRLYDAAKKLADCWCNNLGPAPKKAWYDGHQEMEQAVARFGRFVNEIEGGHQGQKYIDLSKFLLDCRRDGDAYDQSHLPVIQQYEAVGHAVRASYSYSGMADVALETGDIDYQSAIRSLWDNLVNRKYYVTGGIGSGETSEGFGPNYSLRMDAYCESCSSCGMIFMQNKLNLAEADSRYANILEDTLYNALLGSVDLPGKNFYYQNPLDSGQPRYGWHGCPCCVGNIPKTLLMLPTWMYAKSADSIYVNLFIGSTVSLDGIAGTDVQMVQETDYPWSGKVVITVNPTTSKRFSVNIRVPDREVSTLYKASPDCDGIASLAINGTRQKPKIEHGYAVLNRTWKAGDKIELLLPMKVQRIKASEKITATAGKVALRYGPLIYNIERADNGDITKALDPKAPLTTAWRPDLLGGVIVIEGKFADGSPLLAIPNYARNNRGTASPAGGGNFGGPGAVGGGEGGRRSRGPSSIVWIKEQQ